MEAKKVLDIALLAGDILISNGSESYRVEDTVERICNSYGYKSQCITTGKGIFISILDDNQEKVTSLAKPESKVVDLYAIELINDFSRQIEKNKFTYEEAISELKDIKNAPDFKLPVRIFAGGMTCFIYCLFFKGQLIDGVISTFIGMLIYYMVEQVSNRGAFQFFIFFFSGFFIGGISSLAQSLLPILSRDNIIIGTIMVLLPGVAFTNGIKDIVYGDFTSGIARCGEAMLIIAAIGSGIGASLVMMTWI